MKKYLHLGYPKNFSTSLQRNFFCAHKDIYHLGIGIGSNVGYRDQVFSSLFEVYLKSAKGFKYNEQKERLKKHIDLHYNKALNEGKKCFGASSEHFSFGFTYESLDFQTKIDRAIDLFGRDELNIIIVIRNQLDLIRSLYRESVRVGLPMAFDQFLYSLYKFQDRNYLYDLRYDLVYRALTDRLAKENIHFLIFEDLRDEHKNMVEIDGKVLLIDKVSNALEIDYLDVKFKHLNEALSDQEIILKSELNKDLRHDLGREMLFSAEIHRQSDYFKNELNLHEPEEVVYEDVLTKRKLLEEAKRRKQEVSGKLDYQVDPALAKWMEDFYINGNKEFSKLSNIDLHEKYLNLTF